MRTNEPIFVRLVEAYTLKVIACDDSRSFAGRCLVVHICKIDEQDSFLGAPG